MPSIMATSLRWRTHSAQTNISVNSQQPMRRLAFDVISQSETKSIRADSRETERRNNA